MKHQVSTLSGPLLDAAVALAMAVGAATARAKPDAESYLETDGLMVL